MRHGFVLAVPLLVRHHRGGNEDPARVGHGVEQDAFGFGGAAVARWCGEDGVDDGHHGRDAVV